MRKLFIGLCICLASSLSYAQMYLQGSITAYTSSIGSANSHSIDIGYKFGMVETYAGLFDARQNTARSDISWTGAYGGVSVNKLLINTSAPVTVFAAYQWAEKPNKDLDGRYAIGFAWHLSPAKLLIYSAPEQRAWDGTRVPETVGISLKIRN